MRISSELSLVTLFAVLQFGSTVDVVNVFKAGSSAVMDNVVDAGRPAVVRTVYVLESQCAIVKEMMGLDDKKQEDTPPPDTDDLSLVYISKDKKVIFPLRSASTVLPDTLGKDLCNIKLTLFCHGFTDNPSKINFELVNEAFRDQGVDAILALDASKYIGTRYLYSTKAVHNIGDRLGATLYELYKNCLKPENIHLVGHSLGAHISGFTGKMFQKLTNKTIGRITGLDPAGPCFTDVTEEYRLNSTDAEFVDCIHTNAGVFGIDESLCDVDFYPNEGSRQPGCNLDTCNHSFSVLLFEHSIRNKDAFPAVKCDNYQQFVKKECSDDISNMGYGADHDKKGVFYLQTLGEPPYCMGDAGHVYENKDSLVKRGQDLTKDILKKLVQG